MKIVQSLWSKPGSKKEDFNRCSWPDRKYNYFSWALSSLQFRKYYDQLELVTDEAGYELLVNKLGLPYTNVKIMLDSLNHYHSDLWAIGKIFTYSIQDEPFIHADGDVFIWKKFDDDLERSSLICQCREEGENYNYNYSRSFFAILKNFDFYPSVLDKSINKNDSINAVNAGIMGGNNIAFFKDYTREAFEFIDRNIGKLDKIKVGGFNVVYEQFLFYAMAEEKHEKIRYYDEHAVELSEFFDFTGVPAKSKYLHIPGAAKNQRYIVSCLEYRLRKDYPDYYYRIMHLIKTGQI